MRIFVLTILTAGIALAAVPIHAQADDPNFPVCLHVYGPVSYIECGYTSLPQCNMTASGRPAQCEVNPYFAGAGLDRPAARRHRRPYRAY